MPVDSLAIMVSTSPGSLRTSPVPKRQGDLLCLPRVLFHLFLNFCLVPAPCPPVRTPLTTASASTVVVRPLSVRVWLFQFRLPQIHHRIRERQKLLLVGSPLAKLMRCSVDFHCLLNMYVPVFFFKKKKKSVIRSEIHSCGINSITSTISFCIGSMKTFVISSTVRCCTRLCGMIFTVSVTCGTKNRSCQRYAPELTLSEPTESLPQFRLWHVALKCSQSDSRHVPGVVAEKNHMTYLGLDLRSRRIHNLFM